MAEFSIFIKSLRKENNYGKKFELFVRWFLENDPEWSAIVDSVWLWDEWPNRWGPDCGIDLIFKDKNGQTWAVQAKCYDSAYSVTKRDIDSFLSESNRKGIDRRLLISTTDRIATNGLRAASAQEKPVTLFTFKDFDKSPIDFPEAYSELNDGIVKPKPEPRAHQIEAIEAVSRGLEIENRGQLIMACGTGKTFTTLWITERINPSLTLVLLPSLNLLSQTMREWTWGARAAFDVLNVCSDNSISRASEDLSINEASCPVTTEVDDIRLFMTKSVRRVIFCTYHSSELIALAQKNSRIPAFDLIIADEAHRCTGKADSSFTTVLDDNKIRAQKRLFTTATPRIFSSDVKTKANKENIEIYGMDDVSAFGPVLHKLSFGEAIDRDLLTDYKVIVVGVSDQTIKDEIDEAILLELSSQQVVDAESLAAKVAVLKAMREFELTRIITFHSRVAAAKNFSTQIDEINRLIDPDGTLPQDTYCDFVSGAMPTGERKAKIDKLKHLSSGKKGILANARCLAEGVDVPSLDGIAFIDPRGSQIDIIQSVGRAIRKSEAKRYGVIIIPLFVSESDVVDTKFEESKYKPIWDVINALKSHDEELAETIDQCRRNLAKNRLKIDEKLSDKIVLDLPQRISQEFVSSLKLKILENSSRSWEFYFGLLEQYSSDFDGQPIPRDYVTDQGFRLGNWVAWQKHTWEILSEDYKNRLLAIPSWVDNLIEYRFDQNIDALKKYSESRGHTYVTRTENAVLARFLDRVRRQHKHQKLSPEQIEKLLSVPHFSFETKQLSQWIQFQTELLDWLKKNENLLPSQRDQTESGYAIGGRINSVREKFRLGTLPQDRIDWLNGLEGWSWNSRDSSWDDFFRRLEEYVTKTKGEYPKYDYITEDGLNIGLWLVKQRGNKDSLSSERKLALENLLNWSWSAREALWMDNYHRAKSYLNNASTPIPVDFIDDDGVRVGIWASNQRKNYSKGKISAERIELLERIVGWKWSQ